MMFCSLICAHEALLLPSDAFAGRSPRRSPEINTVSFFTYVHCFHKHAFNTLKNNFLKIEALKFQSSCNMHKPI